MAVVSNKVFDEYRRLCEDKWGVKIVDKSDSTLMKAIGALLFFNKDFMKRYVTTIGTTVYWPNAQNVDARNFSTLFHEAQHAYDYKSFPPWFVLSYISPQILALLSILSFVAFTGNMFWLLWLLMLLFAAPIPSFFRTHWEMRGLSCSMAARIWTEGSITDRYREFAIQRFVGPDYYFMWPFRSWMKKKLARAEQRIRDNQLTEVQKTTKKFLVDHGLLGDL